MKVGKRQQQGRSEHTKKREVCPDCGVYYLESFYKRGTGKKIGTYCPNEICNYCKKVAKD